MVVGAWAACTWQTGYTEVGGTWAAHTLDSLLSLLLVTFRMRRSAQTLPMSLPLALQAMHCSQQLIPWDMCSLVLSCHKCLKNNDSNGQPFIRLLPHLSNVKEWLTFSVDSVEDTIKALTATILPFCPWQLHECSNLAMAQGFSAWTSWGFLHSSTMPVLSFWGSKSVCHLLIRWCTLGSFLLSIMPVLVVKRIVMEDLHLCHASWLPSAAACLLFWGSNPLSNC